MVTMLCDLSEQKGRFLESWGYDKPKNPGFNELNDILDIKTVG